MKYILIACIIAFILSALSSSHKHSEAILTTDAPVTAQFAIHKQTTPVSPIVKAKFMARLAHLAICAKQPLKRTCAQCMKPGFGYKLLYFFQSARKAKYPFKMMIWYNLHNIVISFVAPSPKVYPVYIQQIYSGGFYWVKKYGIQVQSEIARVYKTIFRNKLIKQLKRLNKNGYGQRNPICVGHSVGAAFCKLAMFDMKKTGLLKKKPEVYSFGATKVGDVKFVTLVKVWLSVFMFVRKDDYLVRIPSCYSSIAPIPGWRCYTQTIANQLLLVPTSPLFLFMSNYRYSLYYNVKPSIQISIGFRSPVIFGRKRGRGASHKRLTMKHSKGKKHAKKSHVKKMRGKRHARRMGLKAHVKARAHKRRMRRSHRRTRRRMRITMRPRMRGMRTRTTFGRTRMMRPSKITTFKPHFALKKHKMTRKPATKKTTFGFLKTHKAKKRHNGQKGKHGNTDKHQTLKPHGKPHGQKNIAHTIGQLPKLHFKKPADAITYYNTNILIVQPFGTVFCWNAAINSFGMFSCNVLALPAMITSIVSHFSYFGERFDICPAPKR